MANAQPCDPEHLNVVSARYAPRFDAGRNHRGKIGFVLIPNEQTIEGDVVKLVPEGVGVYFARATMPREISTASLARCAGSIADAAGRILPDDKLDVVCFACTSGSVAVGESAALAELAKGAAGARPTTLVTAVKKALQVFGARRIAVATPYRDELNTTIARHLRDSGFETTAFQGLNLDFDSQMIRVAPDYIAEFAESVDTPDAEAVVISCGALRSIEIVDELEKRLRKPVVVSNQAMIWDCLRLAGVTDRIEGYGDLLRAF